MSKMQKKSLDQPDETRLFQNGKIDVVTLGGVMFGRCRFEPGWRWSTCVKPVANTESCEAAHLQYHVSGRMGVRMDDGTVDEFGPGDVSSLPPGHDAWVVGDEPVVVIDISGSFNYAKPHYPQARRPGKKKAKGGSGESADIQALLNELEELDTKKKQLFDELNHEEIGVELLQVKHQFQERRHDLTRKINELHIAKTGEPYFESYYANE